MTSVVGAKTPLLGEFRRSVNERKRSSRRRNALRYRDRHLELSNPLEYETARQLERALRYIAWAAHF